MTTPTLAPPHRHWFAGAALAAAFVAGGLTLPLVTAYAADGGMHHMMGHGHGDTHAMAMAHVSKVLDEVGASADQKSRIEAILHAGFAPMASLHADMAKTHAGLHAILTAPTVDRAALEQLRAAEIARLDEATRTMTKAIADAAEVLTPEQRAKLATLMAQHRPPS
ncbi:MAG TPA: Spy/CpxP family protein refolding chaperone [Caulobacteraceae bacterium]|nr:Spy/CpxP family protein refolding chaperone [Caulobacteraceae bacterium]